MQNAECRTQKTLWGAAALAAVLFCLPSLALAGPIVTMELKDGRKIEADVQWFFEGRFCVRDVQTDETIELDASSIKTIDFGEAHRESGPARPLTLAEVRLRAERQHRFPSLLTAFSNTSSARLKDLDSAIREELGRPGLSVDARRDLGLARVLSLWALGQDDNAKALFAKIRAEHPSDPVVTQFDSQMRSNKQWAAEPPAPLPVKKP